MKFRGHDDKVYYGWILFQGGMHPDNLSGSVLAWAYEDSGGPILAGAGRENNPVAISLLPDMNGSGSSELAVLKQVPSINLTNSVLLMDTATQGSIREIPFLAGYRAISLVKMDDLNGNKSRELAVLGIQEDSWGHILSVRVQKKDSLTGALLGNISFFDTLYRPIAIATRMDMNKNGTQEIMVLGVNYDRASTVQIRDGSTGELVATVPVSSLSTVQAIDLAPIADMSGNGVQEIAVLQKNATTNQSEIKVIDPVTLKTVKTVPCLTATDTPIAMASMQDMNGNGMPEMGVLAKTATGKVKVDLRDMLTGVQLRTIQFDPAFEPKDVFAYNLNRGESYKLAVLGTNPITGKTQVEVRDPVTKAVVKVIPLN